MKKFILMAAVAGMAITSPAWADPGHGRGHGNGQGQARRLNRGQHWQSGYGNPYTYQQIPSNVRRRYALNSRYRYYYNNGYLYQVDPQTLLVQQVISALLH